MKMLSLSEAKMKLNKLLEKVHDTDEEIIVTKNGRPIAVIVSPDEYEGWQEIMAIRSDPEFMAEIRAGLAALKNRETKLYTLDELLNA